MISAARICPSSPRLAANMNDALHRKPTLAASGTALHLSGDQQNSRLYFSPQSSAEAPLFRAFRVRHTSQLCQCAHQVISMIKPCLHRISDHISHLCVLCIFSSGPHASFGPSSCPVDGSKWAILQDMDPLVLSLFDIISIWTAKANQVAEWKREELRCLQAFHNKGWKCHNRAAEGCREQVLISEGVSMRSPLTLSPPQTRNRAKMLPDPEVPRKETAFTVAAVVYNSLWSHLICDTSRHFSQRLLGIWIMKEQWLKSAFSFSTSSVSCPSERQAFVLQLQTPHWRLEVLPMGGCKAWPQLWLRVCKGLTWEM